MKNLNPLEIGDRVARTIMKNHEVYTSSATDISLEGLLYLHDATVREEYLDHVLKVWKFRESHNAARLNLNILFPCLHFETYLRTGHEKYIETFVDDAGTLRNMVTRDQDGAICHMVNPQTHRIFVEMLQGYAIIMARTGWLTDDEVYYNECLEQYEIFREILQNPGTGLWHHGRNWGPEPGMVSPGHWNRAQGWVLRGMVDSLDYLPKGSFYYISMLNILKEYASVLIKYQDARGMWHQLTDKPDAYPETSGTSMFVHYLYKAFHRGWLPKDTYLTVAEKGIHALMGFVHKDGTVSNASQDTLPLPEAEGYLHHPAIPGDPYSAGLMLMACAGPYLARDPKSMV